MSKIRLGSQLFINRNDNGDQIRRWVGDMSQQGFSLIRLFLSWDLIEPRQGQWTFDQFDHVFDAAEEHGLQIVGTLMSVSPPGWMRSTRGMQDIGDLDDPDFWQAGMHYIKNVVTRYAKHPALDSWILWNEPSRVLDTNNERAVQSFRNFLKEKYNNDIEVLNKDYFQQFENFEQILNIQDASSSQLEFMSYTEDIDWLEFTCLYLSEKLEAIAKQTRTFDSVHPVHINPHRISQCMSESGQDIWQQSQICDFIGSSVHPPWHSVRFPKDRIQQSVALFADMMRSASKDPNKRFWVTELQGGPTVFSAFEPSGPKPAELRQWIWESTASGAEAILFWCYNNRDDGFEAGEWGLVQDNGKASKRLQSIIKTAEELSAAQALLDQTSPHAGEIGILVSSNSWNLGFVEGEGEDRDNPRNKQMASDAVCGAYCIAQDLGFEVRFIHEREITELDAHELGTLIAPGCTALTDECLQALQRYVDQGGHLIADGMFAWKLANGRLARHRHTELDQLFGASVGEIYGGSQAQCELHGEFFKTNLMQICFDENESCIARWDDDNVAVIKKSHQHGGSALRLGTIFFQDYFINSTDAHRHIFQHLLSASLIRPIHIPYLSQDIRLRRLKHPHGEVCIIMNNGESRSVELNVEANTAIHQLDGSILTDSQLILNKDEVRVFLLQPSKELETV